MQVAQGGRPETRIDPVELLERLARGERFTLLDVRRAASFQASGRTLPGAVRLDPDALTGRRGEIPRGRTLVLLTDPGEEGSLARRLLDDGWAEVHAVEGGFPALERAGATTVPLPGRREG